MTHVYFSNLVPVVASTLQKAQFSIFVAVCWFTNQDLLTIIFKKLQLGVKVVLVLEYDVINISSKKPNLNALIKAGAIIHANLDPFLMHHKFALIDQKILITGSFNWTSTHHFDHIIISEETELIAVFTHEFNRLRNKIPPVHAVYPELAKGFVPAISNYPGFSELKRRIATGANCWLVRTGTQYAPWPECRSAGVLSLNCQGVLKFFWETYAIWDLELCLQFINEKTKQYSTKHKNIKNFIKNIRAGDILFPFDKDLCIIAAGIVDGDPAPAKSLTLFSTERKVIWVETDKPVPLSIKPQSGIFSSVRGSAMEIITELFYIVKT